MRKRSNRRRKARFACLLVVQYRPRKGTASPWRPASVLDLTDAGCRLRIAEALAGGTRLLLRFEALLRDGVKSAETEAPATVMWCRPHGRFSHELGLELEGLPAPLNEILGALDSA